MITSYFIKMKNFKFLKLDKVCNCSSQYPAPLPEHMQNLMKIKSRRINYWMPLSFVHRLRHLVKNAQYLG